MDRDPKILCVCFDGQMSALFSPFFEQEMNNRGQPCKVKSACSKKEFAGTKVVPEISETLKSTEQGLTCNTLVWWIGDLDLRDYKKILCLDVEAFAFVEDLFLARDMASKSTLIPQAARWSGKYNDPRGKGLEAFKETAKVMSEVIRGYEGIVGETSQKTRITPHRRKISY